MCQAKGYINLAAIRKETRPIFLSKTCGNEGGIYKPRYDGKLQGLLNDETRRRDSRTHEASSTLITVPSLSSDSKPSGLRSCPKCPLRTHTSIKSNININYSNNNTDHHNPNSTIDICQACPGELLRPSSSHVFTSMLHQEASNVTRPAAEENRGPHTIPERSEYTATCLATHTDDALFGHVSPLSHGSFHSISESLEVVRA